MSVDALSGTPRFIDVYGEGEICLISFDDLLDILACRIGAASPPTSFSTWAINSLRPASTLLFRPLTTSFQEDSFAPVMAT
ncbi:hypothetical protein ACC693_38120, partial [Rhizobium ruizarguesonis]